METEFQTSFIPKKPLAEAATSTERTSRPVSIVMLLSVLVFVAALVAAGGVYLYKQYLTKQVVDMTSQLKRAREGFEPALIAQLQTLDTRLSSASGILATHITVSPILKALSDTTLKTIRYTKFTYTVQGESSPRIDVKMSGQSRGYMPIALQNEAFTKNKYIKNPIFSNLTLDDRTGNVTFDLTFSVDPDFVLYGKMPTGI